MNLERNIIFHGFKSGEELNKIFDDTHIAIGSLGVHRKDLKYASTLKVREYMARGIAFIISHIDEDIDKNFPFFLKLPSDDESVDIEKVIKFTANIYNKYGESISSVMRNYASEKMDYKAKVGKLLNFILAQVQS